MFVDVLLMVVYYCLTMEYWSEKRNKECQFMFHLKNDFRDCDSR
jgi:hypothetical protein